MTIHHWHLTSLYSRPMNKIVVHPSWIDHPFVQQAADRSGCGDDAVLLLETLSALLNELEDKAPGIPFADLLSVPKGAGSPSARGAVAGMLLDSGLHWREVDDMLGQDARHQLAVDMRLRGHTLDETAARTCVSKGRLAGVTKELADDTVQRLRELVADGTSVAQAARTIGVSQTTAHRYLRGQVPSGRPAGNPQRRLEIVQSAIETSYSRAAKKHGVTKQYVADCMKWARRQGYVHK